MLDGSHLEALHDTFPKLPPQFESAVLVKMHTARLRKTRTAAIQRAGYLGCYAIGERVGEEIVLRLFPACTPATCPVGLAPTKVIEGTTFSPDLQHWVAGRLVMIEVIPRPSQTAPQKNLIESAAAEFGDSRSAMQVVDCASKLKRESDLFQRSAVLWNAAGKDVPLFRALSLVWSSIASELDRTLEDSYPDFLGMPLLPGVYVALSALYKRKRNLERAARSVVSGDAVFDFTYDGRTTRPGSGEWRNSPWIPAVRALSGKNMRLSPVEKSMLRAAAAFARNPAKYDGGAHLTAASEVMESNAVAAFVLARNAGAFHARVHRTAPTQAMRFLRSLCERQRWSDLELLLRWAE